MKILVFCILILFTFASDLNITKGAGLAVHIRQELFNNLKSSVLEQFVESIKTGDLNDFKYTGDLKVFKVLLDLTKMTLHDFNIDLKNSYLRLQENEPNLQLYVADFSMKFTFDFHLRTNPEFIEDKGNGVIDIGPTSLFIGYIIENSPEGKPQFKIKEAKMT